MRLSLVNMKSPADCLELITRRIAAMTAMTDAYYDIFIDNRYVGEIYARDIDYKNRAVKNVGYFVDTAYQGRGIASAAVNTITECMFSRGIHRMCLFTHYFADNARNSPSERVAEKCGYVFEGIARDVVYDPRADKYASERMYAKIAGGR